MFRGALVFGFKTPTTIGIGDSPRLRIMQVSTYVKEAIDEAVLYSNLEHSPDISKGFCTPEELEAFECTLDVSFFNIFNQTCGYYQLKRFAATCDEAIKLSFIEDATEFRLIDNGHRRLQRYVRIELPRLCGGWYPYSLSLTLCYLRERSNTPCPQCSRHHRRLQPCRRFQAGHSA